MTQIIQAIYHKMPNSESVKSVIVEGTMGLNINVLTHLIYKGVFPPPRHPFQILVDLPAVNVVRRITYDKIIPDFLKHRFEVAVINTFLSIFMVALYRFYTDPNYTFIDVAALAIPSFFVSYIDHVYQIERRNQP